MNYIIFKKYQFNPNDSPFNVLANNIEVRMFGLASVDKIYRPSFFIAII